MNTVFGGNAVVLVGVAPPHSLKVTIQAGTSGLDLTQVTSVSLSVQRSDGTIATWSGLTIQSVTPPSALGGSLLVATYPFASGGLDCPVIGQYQVQPNLTLLSGGVAQAYAQTLFVVSKYNTQ